MTPRHSWTLRASLCALVLLTAGAAGACSDDGPADPGSLRFGQIGRLRIDLTTPLQLGQGELRQILTWDSSGPWELRESISYRQWAGDEHSRQSSQVPDVLAGSYATWIAQVNDVHSLSLFVEGLPPDSDPSSRPTCRTGQGMVVLTIRDTSRGEELSWTRCVTGRLETLTTVGAGPDGAAARVAAAVILARDYSLGEGFESTYGGSVPFGTIDRGGDSGVELRDSFVITERNAWVAFWAAHRGSVAVPPVDFDRDAVIVAAVGLRQEAGDSVEIRRVLPVGDSTFVQRVERVPGDFCSPAEKHHYPFHIVVVPAVPLPVRFVEPVTVERVPCGG